jgi:hypothetical protein
MKYAASNAADGEIIEYGAGAGLLKWHMLKEPPLTGADGSPSNGDKNSTGRLTYADGKYIYTYTYRVLLNNLKDGFEPSIAESVTSYETNGKTVLSYSFDDEAKTPDTAEFALPSVKGYSAPFTFKKEFYSDNSVKLVPALDPDTGETPEMPKLTAFELTTGDDPDWHRDASADNNGINLEQNSNGSYDWYVSFGDLPSGHAYTLTEKELVWRGEPPEGEEGAPATEGTDTEWKPAGIWTVTVDFGKLSLSAGADTPVTSFSADASGNYTIRNDYVPRSTGSNGRNDNENKEDKEDETGKTEGEEEQSTNDGTGSVGGGDTDGGGGGYPFPTYPGQTVVPQDDGSYLVIDDEGVPLGTWSYDPDLEEWIFDEATPLADLPQTGAVLPQGGAGGAWIVIAAIMTLIAAVAAVRRRSPE